MTTKPIDTTKIEIQPDEEYKPKSDTSRKEKLDMLKKIETPFIILGAGLLGFVLVYVFIRVISGNTGSAPNEAMLEERVAAIEKKIEPFLSASGSGMQPPMELTERIDKLEAAMTLKMNVLEKKVEDLTSQRMGMPNSSQLSSVSAKEEVSANPVEENSAEAESAAPVVPKAVKKHKQAPKTAKKGGGSAVYHKVAKGDTLFSISRKYKQSVKTLLELNHMKEGDPIKIDQKLIVK